jgi:hypothetical protein
MSALPAGFAELEPFVTTWAANSAAARDDLRRNQSAEARQAFYDAMTPRLADALALLDARPLAEHDPAETSLMGLALVYAHVAMAVEVQGPDEAKHALARARLPITRATADT